MLDLDADPKLAWALKHRDRFPVDVNRAPRELLLRVPGLGVKAVGPHPRRPPPRPAPPRRPRPPVREPCAAPLPFIVTADHRAAGLDRLDLRAPPRAAARAAEPLRMTRDRARPRRRPRRLPPGRARARRRRLPARGGHLDHRRMPTLFPAVRCDDAPARRPAPRRPRPDPPRRLPPRPRALRPALRAGLAPRCTASATCSRSPPTRWSSASSAWRSRSAATCTRCTPSSASAASRSTATSASSPGSSPTTSSSKPPPTSSSSASARCDWTILTPIGALHWDRETPDASARPPVARTRPPPIPSRRAGRATTRAPSTRRGSTSPSPAATWRRSTGRTCPRPPPSRRWCGPPRRALGR